MSDDGALDVMIAARTDKAAVAHQWAEAKAALDAADVAYEAAKLAYSKAEDAEYHAWQALEALAGRASSSPLPARGALDTDEIAYVTGGPNEPTRAVGHMLASRHSLPAKPIG